MNTQVSLEDLKKKYTLQEFMCLFDNKIITIYATRWKELEKKYILDNLIWCLNQKGPCYSCVHYLEDYNEEIEDCNDICVLEYSK